MANDTVYSFGDYTISFVTVLGAYSAVGEGMGGIVVSPSQTKSVQDVSADGSTMTTKIAGRNAKISVVCQQTSSLNKFLNNLFNTLDASPSTLWTSTQILVTNNAQKEICTATGVSFEKDADKSAQKEGQNVTWSLLATSYSQVML